MTSMIPPARAFVQQYGPMLEQLGATKIETPGAFEIRLTYSNNQSAVNAQAAFNDTVWGAKLVIENHSLTEDLRYADSTGFAKLISQVPGTSVGIAESSPLQLSVRTTDSHAYEGLKFLLRKEPTLVDGPARVSIALQSVGRPGAPA